MKEFKSTFILAGVAVMMGLYIYFIEIKKKESDEKAKEASERVFSFEAGKAKELKIKNSFGDFELEKNEKGEWVIKFPISDTADQAVIAGFLESLANEKFDQVVSEDESEYKQYGLDAPKLTVTVDTADGKTEKVLIGGDAAISGKIYIKREADKKVLFANVNLKTQLDKPIKELRDKRVFRGDKSDVTFLSLKYHRKDNNQQILLEKKDSGWHLVQPVNEVADRDAAQAIVTAVAENLRAVDFPSEGGTAQKNIKKFQLDNPEVQLVLSNKDRKVIDTINISSGKGKTHFAYLLGKAPIYQVDEGSVNMLVKKVDDLRDKTRPFKFNKDGIKQLSIKTGLVKYDIVKKDKWELAVPDEKKQVNQNQVSNLLEKLSNMKVSDFLSGESPRGLNRPKGSIELKDAEGKELFSLAWGEKNKTLKNYFVRTNLNEKPVGVDVAVIDTLPGQTLVEEKKAPEATDVNKAQMSKVPEKPALPGTKPDTAPAAPPEPQ